MKYGYEDADDTTLINHYVQNSDCITIHFMDGSTYDVALTPQNEEKIIDVMLAQAKERSESHALARAQRSASVEVVNAIASSIVTAAAAGCVYGMAESPVIKGAMNVVVGVEAVNLAIRGFKYSLSFAEIQELQKYNIYLNIRNQFETVKSNPNIYANVRNKKDMLNINTLDNFSLADLKQIRSNIRRCETYGALREAPVTQSKKPRH